MASADAVVGRDDLISEIVAAAAEAAAGAGSVTLLSGEAGIGKTTVVRHVAQRVRSDLEVTWGKCVADGSAPPFWPWSALVAAEPTAHDPLDPTIGAPRFELLSGLREQILDRARRTPIMHVIEDLQWADVASVLLLVHLAASPPAPLLIIATIRTGEPLTAHLAEVLEELRRSAPERELGPLGETDISALLRSRGLEVAPAVLDRVRRRTGGNPLFVTELLRAADLDVALPRRVSDLVAHRTARLPTAAADALAVAAVLGAEGDTRTLASVLDVTPEAASELLDQARAAHLLEVAPSGHWQFPHELLRDAVYGAIGTAARARHHAAVLDVLSADPAVPVPVRARHAIAAQPVLEPARAIELAAAAGESALAQHAYEEAAQWFTHALALSSDTQAHRRAELLVLRGEAQRQTGNIDEARHSFLEAVNQTTDAALLARAALGYADPGADVGIAYITNDPLTPTILESALAAQPEGDGLERVSLETRLGAELYFGDQPKRARELTETAIDRARRLGDYRALTAAAAVRHDAYVLGQASLDEQLAGSAQLLEWARSADSASALLTAHRARVFDLLSAGDVIGMDEEIGNFRRLAEPLRVPSYSWWALIWSAMRALLEARHDEAEARAVAAFEAGVATFPSLATLNFSFLLFFLRREQGRFEEMEQATRDYVESNTEIPAIRVALAFLLAEIGRDDEARGMLAALDDAALDRLHDRNWPASWFQLARAAFLVGDGALAARLLGNDRRPSERCVQVSVGTVCLGATDLAEAWLYHALGDLDAADAAYASAEDLNARIGARAWLAQARADHAVLLRTRDATGDHELAERLAVLVAEETQRSGVVVCQPTRQSPQPAAAPRFQREASTWEVVFGGRTARINDARGLSDIAYLLSRPGVAVSVLELAGEGTVSDSTRGDAVFDERAKREIRARLRHLDDEEADAEAAGDGERAALAREQRQELAEAVARDFGLGGESRRMGDTVERARKTVSTRIRRAISAVGKAHPELGRHLERSVDTGAWCAYRPAERLDWKI